MKRQQLAILAAAIAILVLPLLWAMTLAGSFVGDEADLFSYQMPMRDWAAQTLRSGTFPAWNPYVLAGNAAHAGMQLGLLYPPNVACMLATGGASLLLLYTLHLLWLGVGAVVLARVQLGTAARDHLPPQLLAAAVWVGSGITWGHLWAGHVSFVEAWAWCPWLWAAALHALRRRSLALAGLAAVVAALQLLAGHPQVVYLSGAGLLPLLLAELGHPAPPDPSPGWLRRLPTSLAAIAVLLVAVAGAALLCAGQLLPTAAVAGELNRNLTPPHELAAQFAVGWRSLLTVFAPHVWGWPVHNRLDMRYHESVAWLGAFGLAMATVGAVRVPRKSAVILSFSAIFVLLSVGKDTPLLAVLVDLVPGVGTFRVPSRWLTPVAGLLAVLAVDGLATSPAGETARAPKTGRKTAAVAGRFAHFAPAALALLPLGLWLGLRPDRGWWGDFVHGQIPNASETLRATGLELLGGVAALLAAALMLRDRQWHSRLRPWVAAVAVLQAAWFGAQHVGATFQRPQSAVAWSAEDAAAIAAAVGPRHRLATAASLRHADFGGRAGVRVAGAYEPALTREANLYGNRLAGRSSNGYSVDFQVRKPSPWLDRLAVSHLLVEPRDPILQRGFAAWPLAQTLPSGRELRQNPHPLPRFGWVRSAVVEADAHVAIDRIGSLAPEVTVLASAVHGEGDGGPIDVTADTAQGWTVAVAPQQPAVLLVRDALAPGWTATVDGVQQPMIRADGLFRAIPVPAGAHTVACQFATPGLALGTGISALAWLAALALAIAIWRRRQGL